MKALSRNPVAAIAKSVVVGNGARERGYVLVLLSGTLFLSGCGKLESGAHAEPSVRIKLAEVPKVAETGAGQRSPEETTPEISSGPGTISGRVVFKGSVPAVKVLFAKGAATKDQQVCSFTDAIPNEEVVIGADNGIANVFVYLDKPPVGYKHMPPTEPAIFDQRNCFFQPHALIYQTGQPLKILNGDGVVHNTHTFPNKNDPFNSTVAANDRNGVPLLYKKAEKTPFQVKCDFHSWMIAFHLTLDHPFGAVTDKDGNFKIENLPAGKHQFKVWHEKVDGGKGGFLESKYAVTVKAGDNEPLTISADAAKFGL